MLLSLVIYDANLDDDVITVVLKSNNVNSPFCQMIHLNTQKGKLFRLVNSSFINEIVCMTMFLQIHRPK